MEPARVLDNDEGESPNSGVSCFQMEFCMMNGAGRNSSREGGADRNSTSDDDEEENGSTRKKLRLSKDQSAFLEDTFKEHTTLNPVISLLSFFSLFF